jgi:Uma2 family endonuclease
MASQSERQSPALSESCAAERLRFTPEMFHRLGELGVLDDATRYELIEGDIYAMPPEGPEHATVRTRLMYRILALPAGEWHLRVEAPLRLGASELAPELAVVPGRVEDYAAQHPATALLVIEIAATSPQRNRELKLGVYARAGVPECWLVNLPAGCIEVYREPAGDAYKSVRLYTPDEAIAPLFAPEWAAPVGELLSVSA